MATPKIASENEILDELSEASRNARDTVRAAGGDMSPFAVDLLRQIDRGDITCDEAVATLHARYRGTA